MRIDKTKIKSLSDSFYKNVEEHEEILNAAEKVFEEKIEKEVESVEKELKGQKVEYNGKLWTVEDIIDYEGGGLLLWKPAFTDQDALINNVKVTVHFPEPVAPEQLKIKNIGVTETKVTDVTAESRMVDDRTIEFATNRIAESENLEIRIHFPHGIVTIPSQEVKDYHYDFINVDINILPNSDMIISETQKVVYEEGSYHYNGRNGI